MHKGIVSSQMRIKKAFHFDFKMYYLHYKQTFYFKNAFGVYIACVLICLCSTIKV